MLNFENLMTNAFFKIKKYFLCLIIPLISIEVFSKSDEQYTVNFKNIAIAEYISFVSKICNVNFLYEQDDLNFAVTVVSEDQIDPNNVMATLIQILRIHGLTVLEEDSNLVIHKNPDVKQLAKIITDGMSLDKAPPIITRVFRIKNAKIDSIASIIRPMISTEAILELSVDTRQLIITDVLSNIKKIGDLIEIIDSPQNPLEIEIYATKENSPEYLIDLTNQIMTPIAEGDPFILVPQDISGSLFIISTPRLIAKAISVLTSLDIPAKTGVKKQIKSGNIFIYKLQNLSQEEMQKSLNRITENIKSSGYMESNLTNIISTAKWIQETDSFLFIGTEESISKLKELLISIDVPYQATAHKKKSYFTYKPKNLNLPEMANSIKELSKSFKESKMTDERLLDTLDNFKMVTSTQSLLFTGYYDTFDKIKELLESIDTPEAKSIAIGAKSFFFYKVPDGNVEGLTTALKNISSNLKKAKITDVSLIETIETAKFIPETSSLLFVGNPDSLKTVEELLKSINTSDPLLTLKDSYFLYKVKNTSGNIIVEDLDNFAEKLKAQKIDRPNFIATLESAKWIKETNSVLITGHTKELQEAAELVKEFDTIRPEEQMSRSNYFIYKPKFSEISFIEQSLKDTASNLEKAKLADPNLLEAINSMRHIESTNALAFTGTTESIEKIKVMLTEIDVPGAGKDIHKLGKTTFLVYKIEKAAPQKLLNSISGFAADLKKTGTSDKELVLALESVKYKPEINSLLFTGTVEALEKTKELMIRMDSDELAAPTESPAAYFVYKPRYLTGKTLQDVLINFTSHLKLTGFENQSLFNCIRNMKWDDQTQSLLFSGSEYTIEEIKGLLATFDIPTGAPEKDIIQPIEDTSFLVYKLQYHKGDSIQSALKQISTELTTSGTAVKKTLLSAINSIQWIQVTNSLLCSGDRETMSRLKDLINSLDVPLKQVFIEMLVIETSFTDFLSFGLDWGGKYKHRNKFVAGVSNTPYDTNNGLPQFSTNLNALSETNKVQSSTLPFNTGFDLGIIGDIILHKGKSFLSLGSLIEAVQQDNESSIIMTPKILAQDNKPSYLFIGQNVPYIGSQTTFSGANSNTTANLEYRDVGMEITITPVLGNSDTVSLDINLSRSTEQPQTVSSSQIGGVQGILTDKTTMTTTVHIPDKCFLVLSGMGNDSKTKNKSGIPCLGGLPLIGAAFSQNNKTVDKKNIVIFIRPHIINSYKDMENLSENAEDFYRDSAGSPALESEFDDGVDAIKTYNDE